MRQRRAKKIKNETFPVGDPRRWEPGLWSLKRRVRAMPAKPEAVLAKPLNSKQTRKATRAERLKAHNRRYEIGRRYVTGKSARRRAERG